MAWWPPRPGQKSYTAGLDIEGASRVGPHVGLLGLALPGSSSEIGVSSTKDARAEHEAATKAALDLSLLIDFERVVHLNPEVAHRSLQLRVAKQ